MTHPVTLADVAKAAGVSIATASRSLNDTPNRRVNEGLRQRVLEAAASLNYSPNTHAQAIARGRASVIGLVTHDIADPYFSTIAAGVMRRAEEHGLALTVATTHRDPARELNYVRMLRSQRAQGMVLAGSRVTDRKAHEALASEIAGYQAAGGRVAVIGQRRLPIDTVQVENRAGGRSLARALHELGHRNFGILAGPSQLVTAADRVGGFREALSRLGSPVSLDRVVRGVFTRDGGYESMIELLSRGVDLTCVFAANDVMAVGAMAALRDKGIRLPDDMAVAGFGGIAILRDITPALTTVRLPLEQMGEDAVTFALEERADRPRVQRVAGEVLVRESTPALPSLD